MSVAAVCGSGGGIVKTLFYGSNLPLASFCYLRFPPLKLVIVLFSGGFFSKIFIHEAADEFFNFTTGRGEVIWVSG